MACQVCKGSRRITVLAGTTTPSYEMDCPVCACRSIAEIRSKAHIAFSSAKPIAGDSSRDTQNPPPTLLARGV